MRVRAAGTLAVLASMALSVGAAAAVADAARVPELVSVGDGNMGDVLRVPGASDSGDRVVFDGSAITETSRSAFFLTGSMATRSADGWVAQAADPVSGPHLPGLFRFYKPVVSSSDGARILVWTTAELDPNDKDGGSDDLYLVDVATGAATWITHPFSGGSDTTGGSGTTFAGASRDLSTIYFQFGGAAPLGGGAPVAAFYRWQEGELSVASVLPGGAPDNAFPAVWPSQRSGFDAMSPLDGAQLAHGGPHVVSDDGATFFFGSATNGTAAENQGLFLRRDGTTVQINRSKVSGHEGEVPASATFVGASHDGGIAYFFENAQLTDAGSPGGGLYRYTRASGALEQLTPDAADPAGAGVTDAKMSDDASRVYFVATAALAPGAQAGQPNVYVYRDGDTRFIATAPSGATVERSSRSGRFAVIQTTDSIGGAPANGFSTLYEYDDEEGTVVCVSCRADGSPSAGGATLRDESPQGYSHGPGQSAPRNITDDGTVFFASSDQLIADDVNAVADVYEFSDGTLSLLSDGRNAYDSYVQDNGDDGRDAFFVTRSSLVAADQDHGLADLYDARLGGGFPEHPVPTPPCDGSDCQGTAAAPALRTSATETAAQPAPLSAPRPAPRAKRSFKVKALSAAARRQLAAGHAIRLSVSLRGGGRISVTAKARAGGGSVRAGSAARTVSTKLPVVAHVPFRLGKAARLALRRHANVRLTLTVRVSGLTGAKRLSVPLTRPAR